MAGKLRVTLGWLTRHIRNKFLLGIIIIVPVAVTAWVLVWIFNSIDNILQPFIKSTWGQTYPGIGFGIVIILIYIAGIIASSFIGKRLIALGEKFLDRLPLVRQLRRGIKQILASFVEPRETGFMQVVFVEFPRKGMQSIGFITNKVDTNSGEHHYIVFIPTSPNPTSGFLEIVREEDVTHTKLTVEEALRVVVSAGRVTLDIEKV